MKRIVDILASFFGLLLLSPILVPLLLLVWLQDFSNPFYIAPRVGKNEKIFKMFKLRSMKVNADKSGVDSTSSNDNRITKVGKFIRKFKLDELSQLINVFIGDMSLVGPRPNVKRETDLYTKAEKGLLKVKPGITDFSSIIFSDEGDILENSSDPDLDYNKLIRPWKSRLGLFYIENSNLIMDLKLILLTIVAILSRETALSYIVKILIKKNASKNLIIVASRKEELVPFPPPGSKKVVSKR